MLQPACKCNDTERDYDDYNRAYNYDDSDNDSYFDSRYVVNDKNFFYKNSLLATRVHTLDILTIIGRRESDAT